MLDATLLARLKADGWSLNEEAVAQQLEESLASSADTAKKRPEHILKAILDLDLKQVGAPCLPEDINRADSTKLAGPHILQLVEATDISRPTKFQETVAEDRKNRLLRLRLTDGSKTCTAIEYTSIPTLHTKQLIPGVKIKIQNALIRVGSLLLDSKSVSVVGGRVERLAAAWEVQQMYGGTAERTSGGTKDTTDSVSTSKPDKPLPFKHFDAKASIGHDKMKKALAAVIVPTVGVVVQAVGGKNSTATGPGTGPNSQKSRSTAIKDSLPPPPSTSNNSTATTTTSDAAKNKLLERLSAHEDAYGRYGRGGRGGRRGGRRGRFNNDDDGGDDGSMTLEEWEAKKKAGIAGKVGVAVEKSDEQLARELQRQLDLEDIEHVPTVGNNNNTNNVDLQSSLLGMFYSDQNEEEQEDNYGGGSSGGGYSRGRGRGRGGRGRGRSDSGGSNRGGGGRGRSDGGGGSSGRGRGRGPPSRGRGRGGRS